jgi:hypothetical protein
LYIPEQNETKLHYYNFSYCTSEGNGGGAYLNNEAHVQGCNFVQSKSNSTQYGGGALALGEFIPHLQFLSFNGS